MKGLYIHVPFCPKKCPYCDFYSISYASQLCEKYTNETLRRLGETNEVFDTVYFGGGTPSLLGHEKTDRILSSIKLSENAEITLESNPNIDFTKWAGTKINRISLGLQSANENELKILGRSHSLSQVEKSIKTAKELGISNISLDLMIGIPQMSKESLLNSINFCESMGVTHLSNYLLKIEENTPFYKNAENLDFPDDDFSSDLYLFMVEELEKRGFFQYEISNFAKKGFESRHNTKYWTGEEYLAFGPSAHSFNNGKREYFPRDLEYYLNGNEKIFDSYGGDFEEYAMLKLRLSCGISKTECDNFEIGLFEKLLKRSKKIPAHLLKCEGENISLTPQGFLVSNSILVILLDL